VVFIMGSVGFLLADWSIELIRYRSKKRKAKAERKKNEKHQRENSSQTEEAICISCSEKSDQISVQNRKLSEYKTAREKLIRLLSCKADICDLDIIERVEEIRREASAVKSEMEKLQEERLKMTESVGRQLEEKDTAHSEIVRSLEIVVAEKEKQLLQSSNQMRQQLLSSTTETQQLRRKIASLERGTRKPMEGSLEQEMDSLKMVLDMKKEETDQLKAANNSLKLEMERFTGLDMKLQVQKQKTEEMNAVINMKNEQLRQVLDEYDRVQQQLEVEVSAHLACQQELEKSQWSKESFVLENEKRCCEISNQKMSGMVLDVVQKEQALAYSFNC